MDIFISHSSADGQAVLALVDNLRRAGKQVWLDLELKGGEAWWSSILNQIRTCRVFVFAVSEHSLASHPCQLELGYARALGLPILPVQVGDVYGYRTDTIFTSQLIDHRKPTAATMVALFGTVDELARTRVELPNPLPSPPPMPFEYLIRIGAAVNGRAPLSYDDQTAIFNQLRQAYREERDPSVHADIHRLLDTLLRRPETATSTANDIAAFLKSPGKHTQPIPTVPGGKRGRGRVVALAACVAVLLVVAVVCGYLFLRDPSVTAQPRVAWTDDEYGIVVGDPNAPSRIELFMEPQCSHCAEFDVKYGEEISQRINDGTLQVTYRPLTFKDAENQNDYSRRVANALMIAASKDSGTTPTAFVKFIGLLWNPPGADLPDDDAMGALAETSGLTSETVERVAAGEAVVSVGDLDAANNERLFEKSKRGTSIPVVYDEVGESVVDYDNPNWLERLEVSPQEH